jgi:hypothetical protein
MKFLLRLNTNDLRFSVSTKNMTILKSYYTLYWEITINICFKDKK